VQKQKACGKLFLLLCRIFFSFLVDFAAKLKAMPLISHCDWEGDRPEQATSTGAAWWINTEEALKVNTAIPLELAFWIGIGSKWFF
jgi:hypothetical protein